MDIKELQEIERTEADKNISIINIVTGQKTAEMDEYTGCSHS